MPIKPKNWIQKAIKPSTKGALRKALGAKAGKPIPMAKLEKAAKSKNPTMKKRATMALTMKKFTKSK